MDSPEVIRYKKKARLEARKRGVPISIVFSVIKHESEWNAKAQSPKGAASLMQLMPHYGEERWDPYRNIELGVKTLAENFKRWGNWRFALAGYNAGNGAVERYGGIPPYRETQNYVTNVLGWAGKNGQVELGASGDFKTAKRGKKTAPAAMGMGTLPTFTGGVTLASIAPMIFGQGLPPLPMLQEATAPAKVVNIPKTILPGFTLKPPKGVPLSEQPGKAVGSLPDNLFVGYSGSKREMGYLTAGLKEAKRRGLHVGEQTLYDNIDPVHVPRSNHYQLYPGTKVNRAADISGSSAKMAAFTRWVIRTYGLKNIRELYYDPLNIGIKSGQHIGAIGNHSDHVHWSM